VIQEAEAEFGVREVVPFHIVLLDRVVDVVRQLFIMGGGTTALVLVGGNVLAEAQGAEAIASDSFLGCNGLTLRSRDKYKEILLTAALLDQLDADIVWLWAVLAQESYSPPVKILSTSRSRRSTAVAPNCRACQQIVG